MSQLNLQDMLPSGKSRFGSECHFFFSASFFTEGLAGYFMRQLYLTTSADDLAEKIAVTQPDGVAIDKYFDDRKKEVMVLQSVCRLRDRLNIY